MRRLLLLCVLLTAALTAPARAAVGEAPYRIDYGGWLIVPVFVNGQGPYDFLVDTGTSRTLIFQNLADTLKLAPPSGEARRVVTVGATGTYPTTLVAAVDVGGVRLDNLETVVLPDWRVDGRAPQGIVGLDFFRRYAVEFDAAAGRVRFHSTPPETPTGWRRARARRDTRFDLLIVQGRLNRRRIDMLVDTGAMRTLLNDAALGELTRRPALSFLDPVDDARGFVIDGLDKRHLIRAVKVREIRVGEARWSLRLIAVYNATIFKELSRNSTPFGLFGADLLRDRSFIVDYAGGRIDIGPEPAPKRD